MALLYISIIIIIGILIIIPKLHQRWCQISPVLSYQNTNQNRNLVSNCSIFHDTYRYPIWAISGNLQSLYAAIIRRGKNQPFEREQIINSVTDHIVTIDWLHPPQNNNNDNNIRHNNENNHNDNNKNSDKTPIIIFIPGITGSVDNQYTKCAAKCLRQKNWRIVVYNHPGCGGSEIKSPYVILQGDTRDIRTIVNHVHEQYPSAPLVGVGISLGANLLCRYVGEESDSCLLLGAVSLSQGFDGILTVNYLRERPLYGLPLLSKFKSVIRKFSRVFESVEGINLKKVLNAATFHEFDQQFTMKIHRQYSRPDFYKLVSSSNFLDQISVPTLLANATDDPLFQQEQHDIAEQAAKDNNNIITCFTSKGGHAAWVQCGGWFSPNAFSWGDCLTVEWCQTLLERHNNNEIKLSSS
eukprot:gb/GECH01014843.1/.p1 GENE.gb/GECH01014843.1/~~gb/GECH01014843.1/.p1  ORF type:complete len:411 (+),score=79.85 gb/GECH01014843.1/:1-1233(+)